MSELAIRLSRIDREVEDTADPNGAVDLCMECQAVQATLEDLRSDVEEVRNGLEETRRQVSQKARDSCGELVKGFKGGKGLHEGHREHLNALPSGAFDTKDANEIAKDLDIGKKQAQRWRNKFKSKGLLKDEAYGQGHKPSAESVPGVLSVHPVLSVLFNQNGKEINRRGTVENEDTPF